MTQLLTPQKAAELLKELQYAKAKMGQLSIRDEYFKQALERITGLPDSEACKGSPDFIWLQVGSDSGENYWPEKAWDVVTWNDERIHNDDVLYVNVKRLRGTL